MPFEHDTFISPFSWRYGSQAMRQVWSEVHKRQLMRRVWAALASAQHQAGLISPQQLADIQRNVDHIDIQRSLEIEAEIHHDVMAELRTYAEQCNVGGGLLHLGATSADITDNVDVLRIRESLDRVVSQLESLLDLFARLIEEYASLPVMAFTHIQPAEPTTLGYRLASYGRELLEALRDLRRLRIGLRGKGFKGAVGTQASFETLLQDTGMAPAQMEAMAMDELDLPYFKIATQTYPRGQDYAVISALAGLAASLHKFALDVRIMQSPAVGEWSEHFAEKQVGSSAMHFKRNPINAENICSLARYVAALPSVAWDNASQTILERSLDDSANRRIYLPQGFLAVDEMLLRCQKLLDGLVINHAAIEANLRKYGPFAATERLLMALVKQGADRQQAHEWIRQISQNAWAAVQAGKENPLIDLLAKDAHIGQYLAPVEIRDLLSIQGHTGTAAQRAKDFAAQLRRESVS